MLVLSNPETLYFFVSNSANETSFHETENYINKLKDILLQFKNLTIY